MFDGLFDDLPFSSRQGSSMSPGIMDTQLHLAKLLGLPCPMCRTIGINITHPPAVLAALEKDQP